MELFLRAHLSVAPGFGQFVATIFPTLVVFLSERLPDHIPDVIVLGAFIPRLGDGLGERAQPGQFNLAG